MRETVYVLMAALFGIVLGNALANIFRPDVCHVCPICNPELKPAIMEQMRLIEEAKEADTSDTGFGYDF